MRILNILQLITFITCLLVLVYSKPLYNHDKSYVRRVTQLNFEKTINKIRQTTNQVSVIHFYKHSDGASKEFSKEYDELTNEYRGVFNLGACDCDEDASVCEKEKITTFPTVRIYPPLPIPTIDVEGELTGKSVFNSAAKFLHSNVIEITNTNINTFINESPSVPKVLLFTDKKGTPIIFKGLSVSFENKLFFGIVRKEDDILVDRYNIKTFPSIIVVKTTEKKPYIYKGEMKYTPIFDWLNVFSEVFVPGGGSSQDSAATKSWLTETVPELTQKSANDICLKIEGALCVILFSQGKPEKEQIEIFKNLHSLYDRKINRGSDFHFMWLDASIETAWAKTFEYEGKDPKVFVVNPGKRKRFLVHEGDLTTNDIKSTLEKINGGDARFNKISGEIPDFSFRKD